MKIYSWNINGVRSVRKKGFGRWLNKSGADVVAMQETRVQRAQLPRSFPAKGWNLELFEADKKGYSGVGLLSRATPDEHRAGIGEARFDCEGRLQQARFGDLWIVNGYFPNGSGKNRDLSRIPYKLDFYDGLRAHLQPRVDAGEPVLVMGDFNTAPHEIDLARPKQNVKTSGFRPEERAALQAWLDADWVDTWRHFHPDEVAYTWWSQRFGVREKNIGWRIDFILASPAAMERVSSAEIHTTVKGSDHCPISVTLAGPEGN